MKDNLSNIQSKIKTKEELIRTLAYWNFKEKKVVFSNGCFDIIHKGHVEYLAKASNEGDILVIGLNSDNSVKRLKGEERPLQDENTRALILSALQFVDAVVLFDEDTPYELIKFVQPDILVKGSDYKPEDIVGYDIVKNKGGEIKTVDLTQGHSTTNIVTKIKDSSKN